MPQLPTNGVSVLPQSCSLVAAAGNVCACVGKLGALHAARIGQQFVVRTAAHRPPAWRRLRRAPPWKIQTRSSARLAIGSILRIERELAGEAHQFVDGDRFVALHAAPERVAQRVLRAEVGPGRDDAGAAHQRRVRDMELHRHVAARRNARHRDGAVGDRQRGETVAARPVAIASPPPPAAASGERRNQRERCRACAMVNCVVGACGVVGALHLRGFAVRDAVDCGAFGAHSARNPAAQ